MASAKRNGLWVLEGGGRLTSTTPSGRVEGWGMARGCKLRVVSETAGRRSFQDIALK